MNTNVANLLGSALIGLMVSIGGGIGLIQWPSNQTPDTLDMISFPTQRISQTALVSLKQLSKARSLNVMTGPTASYSDEFKAFSALYRHVDAEKSFMQLVNHNNATTQVYGLLGLRLTNEKQYLEVLPAFTGSMKTIVVGEGCVKYEIPVADIQLDDEFVSYWKKHIGLESVK